MTTTNRGLENQAENTLQPGVAFNQLADVLDRQYGSVTVNFAADAALTLTQAQCDHGVLVLTDSGTVLTGAKNVTLTDAFPPKLVVNETAQTLTLLRSVGTGVVLAAGETALIGCGPDDVVALAGGGGGGGGLADGDYGDVTVSGGGTAIAIDNDAVTYTKMQNVSATKRVIGRNTAGAGDPEEVTFSEFLDWVGSAADGDILYRSAGAWTRLAASTNGYVLTLASGLPSWAPAAGGGGGLTNFSESVNNSAPNATVPVVRLLANNAAPNVDAAFSPKGTGAIVAHVPDGTATGGNKRGIYAVDLGLSRSNANQVAGNYAVVVGNSVRANGYGVAIGFNALADGAGSYFGGVAIGRNATTSGATSGSVAIGYNANSTGSGGGHVAIGQGCTTSGSGNGLVALGLNAQADSNEASALGIGTVANASGSSSIGAYANSRSRQALIALGVGNTKPQAVFWIGSAETTDATPKRMAATSYVSTATTFSLPTGMSAVVRVQVLATQTAGIGAGAVNAWVGDALVKNVGGTFTMVAGTLTKIGLEAWTAVLSGDNTLKALVVDVTGEASKSITWSVVFSGVEK